MSNATTNLVARRDTKQGWAQAPRIPMKDTPERLGELAEVLNEDLGWKKYAVEAHTGAVVQQVPVKYEDPADVLIEMAAGRAEAEAADAAEYRELKN